MAKQKEIKTNAMRILDKLKIPYEHHTYECDEFISGVQIADKLSLPHEIVYKTLVTIGNSKNYFVFVIPIEKEIDLKKAARVVGEKSLAMIPVKEINAVTGYIRGGCTPIGMKRPFPTFIHSTCLLYDTIYISAGVRGLQIAINPNTLIEFIGASVQDIIVQNVVQDE